MDLQRQVHKPVLLIQVLFGNVRIVGFQDVKIPQLIQPQQAELPQTLIVLLALFQSDFAPDHLISRGGVSLKFYSANKELLALININIQQHQFLVFIEAGVRNGSEVDVSELAVRFAEILQPFCDFLPAKNVAVFDREQRTQCLLIGHSLVVLKSNGSKPIAFPLFDGDGDIHCLPRTLHDQRDVKACGAGVVDLRFRILHQHFEIAPILELRTHAVSVFI